MKISSFYLNDISDYNDIIEYLYNTIHKKYYGVGVNSVSISRLVTFIKKSLKTYIRLKYQKNISIIVTIPRIDDNIITHNNINPDIIKIRLSYDNLTKILSGKIYGNGLESYLQDIIRQLDTEIISNDRFNFNNYLIVQMNMLIELCINELKTTYDLKTLQYMITHKSNWIKLSQHSSIFNDYYMLYFENNKNNSLFYQFLKCLYKSI